MAFRRDNLFLSSHLSPNSSLNRPFRSPERFIRPETTQNRREKSIEFTKRPYISSKSPASYASRSLLKPSLASTGIGGYEDNIGLYSEIERLSMLNYELKKENDSLLEELSHMKFLHIKVPELEGIIHTLEKDLARKEGSLFHSRREHDFLTINNMNLRGIQPAYHDLVDHNRTLLSEIDRLNAGLKDLKHEKELLAVKNESAQTSQQRLDETERRIQILCEDLAARNEEVEQYRARISELNEIINTLTPEHQKLKKEYKNISIEKDVLQALLKDFEGNYDQIVDDIREKIQVERDTLIEYEKSNLNTRHQIEVRRKDDEISKLKKLIDELEERLVKMGNDNDHLQKRNIEKAEEVGSLELKISQMEFDREELKRKMEKDAQVKLNTELKDQNKKWLQKEIDYETQIQQLKNEVIEVDRLTELIKRKENELEMIKSWSENNEKTLEKRIQEALEAGVRSTTNQYLIEKSVLENEVSANKDKVTQLERQIVLMTTEAERLNSLYSLKVQDVNELQKKVANQDVSYKMSLEDEKFKQDLEKKQALDELRLKLETETQTKVEEFNKEQGRLEEKIAKLVDENNKLTITADERLRELEDMKLRAKVTEETHKEQVQDTVKRGELAQKLAIEQELQAASLKFGDEKTVLEDKIIQLTLEVEKKNIIERENAELRNLVEEREAAFLEEKNMYVELENKRSMEISEFREQFEGYKKASIDMSASQLRFEVEKASLNSQIIQYREEIRELEKRIDLILGENEKIKELYNSKINELEVLRKSVSQLEARWENEKGELERENQEMKRANLEYKEKEIRLASEKTQYENQIKQLKVIKENGRQELEKLYELMNQRKKEYDHYIKQNDDLKKEVDRLNKQAREFGSASKRNRENNVEMDRLLYERDMYKEQAESYSAKLQRTHEELNEKIGELDRSRHKYDEALGKLTSQLDSGIAKQLLRNSLINEGSFHAGES